MFLRGPMSIFLFVAKDPPKKKQWANTTDRKIHKKYLYVMVLFSFETDFFGKRNCFLTVARPMAGKSHRCRLLGFWDVFVCSTFGTL